MKRILLSAIVLLALILSTVPAAAGGNQVMGVNVVLKTDITNTILADLGKLGKVRDVVYEIDALTMQIKANDLAALQALLASKKAAAAELSSHLVKVEHGTGGRVGRPDGRTRGANSPSPRASPPRWPPPARAPARGSCGGSRRSR